MKTILITGAGRGIGRATACALAKPDIQLVLTARTIQELEVTDDMVRAKGGCATLVQHDLRNFPGIQEMARSLQSRYEGGLDGLVLNAATLGRLQCVEDMDAVQFSEVVETNLVANFVFLQTFAPLLRKAKGHLVALTSRAASHPRAYWGAYAATKSGLEALIRSYAAEMNATFCVTLFDPGRVRTHMRATACPGEDPMSVRAPDEVGKILADLILNPPKETGQRLQADDFFMDC